MIAERHPSVRDQDIYRIETKLSESFETVSTLLYRYFYRYLQNRFIDIYRWLQNYRMETKLSESFETDIAVVFTIVCLYFTENTLQYFIEILYRNTLQKILCLDFSRNNFRDTFGHRFIVRLYSIVSSDTATKLFWVSQLFRFLST